MTTLRNPYVSASFSESGALSSLQCIATGRELLSPHAAAASPFAVWTNPIGQYGAEPTEPSAIYGKCLTPADSAPAECRLSEGAVSFRYDLGGVGAELQARLDGIEITLSLTLTNRGNEPVSLLPVFPSLSSVDLEAEKGAKMLIMNQAGYVGPCWQHRGGFYGNTWVHSAQFGCLFDEAACLGFYIKDAEFTCKDISYQKPSFEIRWAPGMALAPGESVTLPEVALLIYAGSWMKTARAYGDWFRKTTHPDGVPEWVKDACSYNGVWAVKKGTEDSSYALTRYPMDTFDEMDDQFHIDPLEIKEYAFYCELSSRLVDREGASPCGSGSRLHTDGWNVVRPDMGGAESMARGIQKTHKIHRRVTLYIEGLITPPESDLYINIPEAKDWQFMDPDAGNGGGYADQGWRNMCPGSSWQDHLAQMAARLVRETDCDGIRLDCLGCHFKPCWNPTHNHKSPYDYNSWMLSLFTKVAAAVKAVKPDVLLSTEYPVDYFSIHFNHALFQPFEELVWHSLKAPSPLNVALPHYRVDSWYGGSLSQAMQLLPMSNSCDIPWHETRHAVKSLFHDGEIMPDPTLSRADAECRRTRKEEGDLLLFARPDAPESPRWNIIKHATTGELPLKTDYAETEISLPLEYEPAEIYELDVNGGTVRILPYAYDGATLTLRTGSSFCAIVIRRAKGAAYLECRAESLTSGAIRLTATSPALASPVPARLTVEGLAGAENLPVMVPGTIRIDIPKDATPGKYLAFIEGEGIASTLKVLSVDQT